MAAILGGNIQSKARYPYTTAATPTGGFTVTYSYGDSSWKDKMTAYDGKGIAYNAIGNPTAYDGWSCTWEGRRLTGMTRAAGGASPYGAITVSGSTMTVAHTQGAEDAGDTFTVDSEGNLKVTTSKAQGAFFLKEGMLKAGEGGGAQNVSYQYNADGLRVSKTADGVTTDYTLHGKLVTHLKQGADELHFFYDAQSRPALVDFNGTIYSYVHNLQGDIVYILDAANTRVVEYKYDAWGKPTATWSLEHATDSTLTSEYEKLARLNPFRYRGYVWDEETGLYYLRSRYYDPAWGRFLNADGILDKGSNVFSYCENASPSKIDPNGRAAMAAGASIGSSFGPWGLVVGLVIGSLFVEPLINNDERNVTHVRRPRQIKVPQSSPPPKPLPPPAPFVNPNPTPGANLSPDQEDESKKVVIFPVDPYDFNPKGLTRLSLPGSYNGRIIKWLNPAKETIFEWNEDFSYGPHYHIREYNAIHYRAGEEVPEPYASIYF